MEQAEQPNRLLCNPLASHFDIFPCCNYFFIPEREVDRATSQEALSRWKRPAGDEAFTEDAINKVQTGEAGRQRSAYFLDQDDATRTVIGFTLD